MGVLDNTLMAAVMPTDEVHAGARAEALSWAPNTRRAYVAGWNDFTSWCLEHRCAGLPASPSVVGRYPDPARPPW